MNILIYESILENIFDYLEFCDAKNLTITNKKLYQIIKNSKFLCGLMIAKVKYHNYCVVNLKNLMDMFEFANFFEQQRIVTDFIHFAVINKKFVDAYPNFKNALQQKMRDFIIKNKLEFKNEYQQLFGTPFIYEQKCQYVPKTGKNKNKVCGKCLTFNQKYCNIHKRYIK